jgi:arylsulfatase A
MKLRTIALGLLTLMGCASGPSARAADKPNFILINIDDLGYADIGPFGSKLNRTPHLDRMATEGCKLTSFYAAPVCSPSRAALMTGCYPKRVLPIPGVLFPCSAVGLNPAERTVADLLKEAGYTTACIGKWHLGDQPEFLPRRRGFDYYLGTPYSNDMGPGEDGAKSSLGDPIPARKKGKGKPGKATTQPVSETGITGGEQPPLALVENETVIARIRQPEQQASVKRYTEAAVKFIRSNQTRPFFLYLAHNAVHFPLYPGKEFQRKSANGNYGDWVEEMDWSVGQVLSTVSELKLAGKTVVIFFSDNGGTRRAINAPLRGYKSSTWEGGMRVPAIAWAPGQIPAGSKTDAIAGMFDILPTFVKLAGGKLPADRKLDGGDIWPLLTGVTNATSPHEVFYYFHGLNLRAVRTGAWKLHLATAELYNLTDDIGESKNVADANPDVVKRLKALSELMENDLGLKGTGPGVRPLGHVSNPKPLMDRAGTIRVGFAPK